ncbi:MAG: virulence factor [Acidimicrobiia bacterium]|nr:virulence factor [Acidimicrobiia bacterium]
MPRGANEVVVIMWRDIPAQVNGQAGRERHQVLLSDKFQRAIDRAKRKARIVTAQDDVTQWRRISHEIATGAGQPDAAAAADAEAARLEQDYGVDRLGRLAFAGGWAHDVEVTPAAGDDLAALEELDDDEREPREQHQ